MLSNHLEKIKSFTADHKNDLAVALIILLVSMTAFGLGRLSVIWPTKSPISIENVGSISGAGETPGKLVAPKENSPVEKQGKYVASKNGKNYHYPWCPSASKIKEENKIWFQTKGDAEKAGYVPAGNCPGL